MDDIPWAEKYRPNKLDDILLDEIVYKKINIIFSDKDIPNLLITGPSGVGKTTLVYCIIKTLFGGYTNQGVFELNASDERGIKSVQETIKFFCKKKVDYGKDVDKLPKHKIVILDEADNISSKAQHLINILMEEYLGKTRFILTCNYTSKIVEAIQSRCSIIKLHEPSPDKIMSRLKYICKKENVVYNKNAIFSIAEYSRGDVRGAINNLQLIALDNTSIDNNYVNDFFDKNIYKQIDKLLIHCLEGKIIKSLNIIHNIKNDGYSILDIMQTIFQRLKNKSFNKIDEHNKIKFLDIISLSLYYIGKGLDNDIQLSACISEMCMLHI